MRTLEDVKKKREEFFKSIKNISFKCESREKKDIEKTITINCCNLSKLY